MEFVKALLAENALLTGTTKQLNFFNIAEAAQRTNTTH